MGIKEVNAMKKKEQIRLLQEEIVQLKQQVSYFQVEAAWQEGMKDRYIEIFKKEKENSMGWKALYKKVSK
jgi:hypothetical protein